MKFMDASLDTLGSYMHLEMVQNLSHTLHCKQPSAHSFSGLQAQPPDYILMTCLLSYSYLKET